VFGYLDGSFQQSQPEATKTSGTLLELMKLTAARWVGVPRPLKIAYTLSWRISWWTSDTVLDGS